MESAGTGDEMRGGLAHLKEHTDSLRGHTYLDSFIYMHSCHTYMGACGHTRSYQRTPKVIYQKTNEGRAIEKERERERDRDRERERERERETETERERERERERDR